MCPNPARTITGDRLHLYDMTTYSAVVTTGIYCRPGCNARPLAENVRTFELAAAAEAAGYRACLRCRPYRAASPVAADTPELVCRAVQLIIDGILDDAGTEADLAARLGFSPRHLRRLFIEDLGVTPDQLARSRRAHFARRLLDDSDLNIADVAFASGFGSIRQFNREMREIFRASPRELRGRRHRADRLAADGGLAMRLPFQPPYDWDGMLRFFADRAVPGVESVEDGAYRRTISLDGDPGVLEIQAGDGDYLLLRAHLPYWEGLIHVVERVARMVGADADPGLAMENLGADPVIGALVSARPGIRVPGAWGPLEVAIHAIVAEHGSLRQARGHMGALVETFGQSVPGLSHGLGRLFPSAEVAAAADLTAAGLSPVAAAAARALAGAVVAEDVVLDGSTGLADLVSSLTAAGIGVTVAHQIALRLGLHDAYPESDPHLRTALRALDVSDPAGQAAARWRPWRAVAATHLIVHAADAAPAPALVKTR